MTSSDPSPLSTPTTSCWRPSTIPSCTKNGSNQTSDPAMVRKRLERKSYLASWFHSSGPWQRYLYLQFTDAMSVESGLIKERINKSPVRKRKRHKNSLKQKKKHQRKRINRNLSKMKAAANSLLSHPSRHLPQVVERKIKTRKAISATNSNDDSLRTIWTKTVIKFNSIRKDHRHFNTLK